MDFGGNRPRGDLKITKGTTSSIDKYVPNNFSSCKNLGPDSKYKGFSIRQTQMVFGILYFMTDFSNPLKVIVAT